MGRENLVAVVEEDVMNHNGTAIDLVKFDANRRQIPWEQLAPFAGQHVAFSADGTRVVASGFGHEALGKRLDELGIDSSMVVWSYIPALDEESWL
jgi:hypothetical protein